MSLLRHLNMETTRLSKRVKSLSLIVITLRIEVDTSSTLAKELISKEAGRAQNDIVSFSNYMKCLTSGGQVSRFQTSHRRRPLVIRM